MQTKANFSCFQKQSIQNYNLLHETIPGARRKRESSCYIYANRKRSHCLQSQRRQRFFDKFWLRWFPLRPGRLIHQGDAASRELHSDPVGFCEILVLPCNCSLLDFLLQLLFSHPGALQCPLLQFLKYLQDPTYKEKRLNIHSTHRKGFNQFLS